MESQTSPVINIELYQILLERKNKLIEKSKKWLKENPEKARINNQNSYQRLKEYNPEKYQQLLERKRKYYIEKKNKKTIL